MSFSPSSALHVYIPYLHSSTWSAPISSFSALFWDITKSSVKDTQLPAAKFDQNLIWRAAAGGQCEFGEVGRAQDTPGDHSDHRSVLSPGQAKSSLPRPGKIPWPVQMFPAHPWGVTGCSVFLLPPPWRRSPRREAKQGASVLSLQELCTINNSCIGKSPSHGTSECTWITATLSPSGCDSGPHLCRIHPLSIPQQRHIPQWKLRPWTELYKWQEHSS